MPEVKVTIDGVTGTVPAESTILQAAERLGIEIPTLCNHPAIEPIGACRICLVEVEKQRVLQPACTFPVSDGIVVHTESPAVVEARQFVLQLLFSERNHFCMFCQMSGSCELQDLAYKYGLDHWEFNRPFPKYEVDATRTYFVMDPNRCILCRRCIRACDELVGNATLGLKQRGVHTSIIADLDVPFGDSSCVSCGTCLQVCPTGALMDRASAYMGDKSEVTRVRSRCMSCSVGCGVELVVRDGHVIRVEGDWDAEPNHGLLCEVGRFHLLHETRQRVREPLVRRGDGLRPATWDEALQLVSQGFAQSGGQLTSLISGLATNEVAEAILKLLPGDKAPLEGAAKGSPSAPLSSLDEADLFVVIGVDLTEDCEVASFPLKRGIRQRRAPLIIVDDGDNGLDSWARAKYHLDDIEQAFEVASKAQAPAVICDAASYDVAAEFAARLAKCSLVCLAPAGNAVGLAGLGLNEEFVPDGAAAYYVLAGESKGPDQRTMAALEGARFVVVQAAFREPWDAVADVILPTPLVFEKSGTVINTEGRAAALMAAVKSSLPSEVEIVERLAGALSR